MSGTYARIAGLPVRIEGYELEVLTLQLAPEFVRLSTVITLHGGGERGVGEDVVYDPVDHEAQLAAGPVLPLAGEWTIDGLSRHLDGLDLFPQAPVRPQSLEYRRWAFESAALDLALRQAGISLGEALGREPRPVRFVVSTRLDGGGTERLRGLLEAAPGLRFKHRRRRRLWRAWERPQPVLRPLALEQVGHVEAEGVDHIPGRAAREAVQ